MRCHMPAAVSTRAAGHAALRLTTQVGEGDDLADDEEDGARQQDANAHPHPPAQTHGMACGWVSSARQCMQTWVVACMVPCKACALPFTHSLSMRCSHSRFPNHQWPGHAPGLRLHTAPLHGNDPKRLQAAPLRLDHRVPVSSCHLVDNDGAHGVGQRADPVHPDPPGRDVSCAGQGGSDQNISASVGCRLKIKAGCLSHLTMRFTSLPQHSIPAFGVSAQSLPAG